VKRNFLNIQPPKHLKRYLKNKGNIKFKTPGVNTIIYLVSYAPPIINGKNIKLDNEVLLMFLTKIMVTSIMNAGFLHRSPVLLHDVGTKEAKRP